MVLFYIVQNTLPLKNVLKQQQQVVSFSKSGVKWYILIVNLLRIFFFHILIYLCTIISYMYYGLQYYTRDTGGPYYSSSSACFSVHIRQNIQYLIKHALDKKNWRFFLLNLNSLSSACFNEYYICTLKHALDQHSDFFVQSVF